MQGPRFGMIRQNHSEFRYRLGRARVTHARPRGNLRQSPRGGIGLRQILILQPLENSRDEPIVHRMHAREFAWSLDLGTGSRISDPAMKLVGIPAVSRTCTSHCHCTNLKFCVLLLIV